MPAAPESNRSASFADLWSATVTDPKLMKWGLAYAKNHQPRVALDVELAQSLRPRSVLNIGGAPFLFEHLLHQADPSLQIASIDLEPERFGAFCQSVPFRIIAGNIETGEGLSDIPGTCDLVVFNQVFEHCRIDLVGLMERMAGFLAPDGKLLITTPNGLSMAGMLRMLQGKTGPALYPEWSKLEHLGHMGHVREYSLGELDIFFRKCGFTVERAEYRRFPGERSSPRSLVWKTIAMAERRIPWLWPNLLFVLSRP
jgi:SAM-dependent methyltransferase